MTIEQNRSYWDSFTDFDGAKNKMGLASREIELQKYFTEKLNKTQRILDLGVGVGIIYNLVKNVVNPYTYFGADISQTMLNHCIKNTNNEFPVIWLRSAELPFLDNYFDVVICYSVFTHLEPLTANSILGEIKRVLKNGGKSYISIIEEATENLTDFKRYIVLKSGAFQQQLVEAEFKILSQTKVSGEPQNLIEVQK